MLYLSKPSIYSSSKTLKAAVFLLKHVAGWNRFLFVFNRLIDFGSIIILSVCSRNETFFFSIKLTERLQNTRPTIRTVKRTAFFKSGLSQFLLINNNNNNNYLNTRNVPLVVPFLKVHGYVPYSMLTLEFTSCYTTVSAPCNILYNSALCSIEIPLKPISALNFTSGYSVHLKSECNDILKKNVSESSLFFPFFYYKKQDSNQNLYSNSDSKNEVCCSRYLL